MWNSIRLKRLRRLYGEHFGKRTETQSELAMRLGVDVTTIQCWEQDRGEPSGPAARLLTRLEEDILARKPRQELETA